MREVYKFDLETRVFLCVEHILDDAEIPEDCAENRPEDGKFSIPKRNESNDGWIEGKIIDLEIELQNAKDSKILELNFLCNQVILGGYNSNCTGENHRYKFDEEYQRNFGLTIGAVSISPEILEIPWPTVDFGILVHSRENFIQLYLDGKAFMESNLYRYFGMKAQVLECTEISQIEAFVW